MKVYKKSERGSVFKSSVFLVISCGITFFAFYSAGCRSFLEIPDVIYDFYLNSNDIFTFVTCYVIVVLILPIISFLYFIISVVSSFKSKKEYWNFLPGRIDFHFPHEYLNFSLSYSDIEKLHFVIHTTDIESFDYRCYLNHAIAENIRIEITLKDKKKYEIETSRFRAYKMLIDIISYARSINNITYAFTGVGDPDDWTEKLDNYINYGYKNLLGKNHFWCLFALSLFLCIISLFFLIVELVVLNGGADLIILTYAFFISFFIDIVLIIDKERDYKFELSRGNINNRSILCRNFIISYLVIKMIIYFIFYYIVK